MAGGTHRHSGAPHYCSPRLRLSRLAHLYLPLACHVGMVVMVMLKKPQLLSSLHNNLSSKPLPHHTTPHHTTAQHSTPHHTTPHHTTLHHTTPHHPPAGTEGAQAEAPLEDGTLGLKVRVEVNVAIITAPLLYKNKQKQLKRGLVV